MKSYVKLAMRTRCPQGEVVTRRLLDQGDEACGTVSKNTALLHGCIGLAGESGELATAMQRWMFYGKKLDLVNIKEEIGDCFWYIAEICEACGFDPVEIMEKNIAKLQKRYPEKFTEDLAAEENRDRAAERKVLESPLLGTLRSQNGQGWAEPPEEGQDQKAENPYVKRELKRESTVNHMAEVSHDYPALCRLCRNVAVHRNNRTKICGDCMRDLKVQLSLEDNKNALSSQSGGMV